MLVLLPLNLGRISILIILVVCYAAIVMKDIRESGTRNHYNDEGTKAMLAWEVLGF